MITTTAPCPECAEGDRPGYVEVQYCAHQLALSPSFRWEDCEVCHGTGEVPACEDCGEPLIPFDPAPRCQGCEEKRQEPCPVCSELPDDCECKPCRDCGKVQVPKGERYCRKCDAGREKDAAEREGDARREERLLDKARR